MILGELIECLRLLLAVLVFIGPLLALVVGIYLIVRLFIKIAKKLVSATRKVR